MRQRHARYAAALPTNRGQPKQRSSPLCRWPSPSAESGQLVGRHGIRVAVSMLPWSGGRLRPLVSPLKQLPCPSCPAHPQAPAAVSKQRRTQELAPKSSSGNKLRPLRGRTEAPWVANGRVRKGVRNADFRARIGAYSPSAEPHTLRALPRILWHVMQVGRSNQEQS